MSKRIRTGRLIAEAMANYSREFEKVDGIIGRYWYRRKPQENGVPSEWFFRIVSIHSSQKWQCFEVDVYTGVFPVWNRRFGSYSLRCATGLPNLRLGSGAIPMEEVAYSHDGTEAGAEAALSRIIQDLVKYANPCFEEAERRSHCDPLVRFGLRWIEARFETLPADVMDQIESAFESADFRPYAVQFPVLTEIKEDMRRFAAEQKMDNRERSEIPILALDLFRYVQLKKQSGFRLLSKSLPPLT